LETFVSNAGTSGILAVFFLLTSAGFSQEPQQGTPQSEFPGRQLIAWSELQKPQPAPAPQIQLQPVTVFTGMIKNEGGYVLETANGKRYALDAQKRAESYLGKRVRVAAAPGSTGSGSLHVVNIVALE
jgi:hypothetical protein